MLEETGWSGRLTSTRDSPRRKRPAELREIILRTVSFPSLTAISKLLEFCQVADDDWPMPSMEAYPRKSPLRSQLVDALGGELGVCRRGQTLAGDLPHAGPVKV